MSDLSSQDRESLIQAIENGLYIYIEGRHSASIATGAGIAFGVAFACAAFGRRGIVNAAYITSKLKYPNEPLCEDFFKSMFEMMDEQALVNVTGE